MKYIDPHIHCVSRTTDDYLYMARCGVVAVSEPAFWAGFDRSTAASFADYFRHLIDVEPKRAAQYGIDHYCWLCINAKEAENVELSREVIKLIPPLLDHPRVLGVGEIGLNKNTRNEITDLRGAGRDRREARPAHPDPHAAPGGQAQGHVDHHRHPEERPPHQARARADRPLRRAHDPHRPRQRLLGRADDLPGHQGHPAARRRHPRDSSARR